MGKYINLNSKGKFIGTSYDEKIKNLILDGASIINSIDKQEFESNLVCVVDNFMFAAAAYAYCKEEFEAFKEPDQRRKTWLKYPHAEQTSK